MFDFIHILKSIATILITNSHYGHIWPISALAFGGILGDVLFFAVSGFCLQHIKEKFYIWYAKRIFRIFPVLWIVNTIAVLIGFFKINNFFDFVKFYIYPTYYHFIASIMLLYVIFYVLVWLDKKSFFSLEKTMVAVFLIYILYYIFVFDRSYYHIDSVEEHTVRFLFLESMLLGALFRKKLDTKSYNYSSIKLTIVSISTIVFLVLYFCSKLVFSKVNLVSNLQILNQIVLFALLFCIFYLFCLFEKSKKLLSETGIIGKIIKLLSKLTLEIYITQYIVFYLIPDIVFPINFFVVTTLIIIIAFVSNFAGVFLTKKLNSLIGGKSNDK